MLQNIFLMCETSRWTLCMSHHKQACLLPNLQPSQVRSTNFYQAGDKTPYAQPLVETPTLERTWTEVQTSAGFETLQASVASFNKANRWRKRGVALIPVKYGMQQHHASAGEFRSNSLSGRDSSLKQACRLRSMRDASCPKPSGSRRGNS